MLLEREVCNMLNNYDFKYIFRKVLVFFIIFIILSLLKSCKVHAETFAPTIKLGGSVLNTNNYVYKSSGNNTFNINYDGYWGDSPTYKWYVSVVLCMDDDVSSSYSDNSAVSDIQVFNTQYGCYYPNSSYTGGHVVILNYKQTGGGSYNNANIVVYFAGNSSVALIDFQTSANSFVDSSKYSSIGSLIEQKKLYEQNQTIINQNNTTNQKLDENKQAINDLNDDIKDDNVSGAESSVDSLLNNSAFNDNSGIQSIINAPLNFINGLTNSCSPIQVSIPYIDTPLSIPCIKQELTNHVPTIVPILSTAINGFIIYRILIDIVYLIKSARNPDDDRIEVLDL